jgi:chromate transporter
MPRFWNGWKSRSASPPTERGHRTIVIGEGQARKNVSLARLGFYFAIMSATNFGGGGAVRARRIFVRRTGLMTDAEFLDVLSLAQIVPGPNQTNIAVLVGQHFRGTLGAAVCLSMAILPGFLILMLIATLYVSQARSPLVEAALRGSAAAAVGLQLANAIELTQFLRNPLAFGLIALTAVVVCVFHVSLGMVLLTLGLGSVAFRFALQRAA